MLTEEEGAVLLYDGDCRLCQGTVRFVRTRLKKNKRPPLRFVAAQSDEGQVFLERVGRANKTFHSVLLLEGAKTWERSAAVLRTARWMRFPWRGLVVFRIVPRPLRDAVYDLIAKNRYRWFGKSKGEACACATDQRREPRS